MRKEEVTQAMFHNNADFEKLPFTADLCELLGGVKFGAADLLSVLSRSFMEAVEAAQRSYV